MCNISGQLKNISKEVSGPLVIIFTICSVAVTICNATLLTALIRTKQVKSPTLLIVCLCVMDLLNGAVSFPLFTFTHLTTMLQENCLFQQISVFTFGTITSLSMLITVLITVERYCHMDPNIASNSRLKKLCSRPYVYGLLAAVFFIVLFHQSLTIVINQEKAFSAFKLSAGIVSVALLASVSFLYFRGYARVRRFVNESPVYQNSDGIVARPLYVRRLFKTVLLLNSVVFISYLPLTTFIVIDSICDTTKLKSCLGINDDIRVISMAFFLLGPLLNPIVVLMYNNEARNYLKGAFQHH